MAERRPTSEPRPGGLGCARARALLARDAAAGALELRPLSETERAGLERHVADCAACQTRLDQLATAVLSLREDEIPCVECGEALDDWLTLMRSGEDPADAMPWVAAHLSGCPECSLELAVLDEAWRAIETGTLPEPASAPAFDFSFLRPPAGTVDSAAGAALDELTSAHDPSAVSQAHAGATAGMSGARMPADRADDAGADAPRLPASPAGQPLSNPADDARETLGSRLRRWLGAAAPSTQATPGAPPARRALGELLLPLGALALVLMFLAAIARPDEPATIEPGATATATGTARATATPSGDGASPRPRATVDPRDAATPEGGIVPARAPATLTATPAASPSPPAQAPEADRRDRDNDNRGSEKPAVAATLPPSPAPGYPGPGPEARPTDVSYPGPPTQTAGGSGDPAPTSQAYPPPSEATSAPTQRPTARPGPAGTPTAESVGESGR
jgi:hypothetical protein